MRIKKKEADYVIDGICAVSVLELIAFFRRCLPDVLKQVLPTRWSNPDILAKDTVVHLHDCGVDPVADGRKATRKKCGSARPPSRGVFTFAAVVEYLWLRFAGFGVAPCVHRANAPCEIIQNHCSCHFYFWAAVI